MSDEAVVTKVAPGTFRVEHAGKREIVYVAGSPGDRWAFWNGHVFRSEAATAAATETGAGSDHVVRTGSSEWAGPDRVRHALQSLSAPMPATVIRVLASPGTSVKKGDTIVVLEAMKMEWPIRALSDGTIKAVHCHEGQLVQSDVTLIELE